jgi:hypothetical protein
VDGGNEKATDSGAGLVGRCAAGCCSVARGNGSTGRQWSDLSGSTKLTQPFIPSLLHRTVKFCRMLPHLVPDFF